MTISHFTQKGLVPEKKFMLCQNLLNIFRILVALTDFLNKSDMSEFP